MFLIDVIADGAPVTNSALLLQTSRVCLTSPAQRIIDIFFWASTRQQLAQLRNPSAQEVCQYVDSAETVCSPVQILSPCQLNRLWYAAAAGWMASAGVKVGTLWQKLSWVYKLMVVLVRICASLACICEPAVGDWNALDGLWGCPFGSKVRNGPFASTDTVEAETLMACGISLGFALHQVSLPGLLSACLPNL